MSTTDILSSSTCVCQVRGGIDPIRSAFGTYAGGLANSLPPKIFRKTIEAFVRTFLIIDNPVRCAYRLRTREVTLGGVPTNVCKRYRYDCRDWSKIFSIRCRALSGSLDTDFRIESDTVTSPTTITPTMPSPTWGVHLTP